MRRWLAPVLAALAACVHEPPAMTARPEPARPEPARRSAVTPTAEPREPDFSNRECGELALERRALEVAGRGERHPEVLAVERELSACSDQRPSASACRRVLREHASRTERGYGPRHPEMRTTDAKLELCREVYGAAGAPPLPLADCETLRSERARLIAAGNGERHPAMLAVDGELEQCNAPQSKDTPSR
ncbi:MAG: hypothetical protein IT375_08765 [Polyangiaceae bacterium]|nr:hypothetical protein [Polyangiaceae bacterium]